MRYLEVKKKGLIISTENQLFVRNVEKCKKNQSKITLDEDCK